MSHGPYFEEALNMVLAEDRNVAKYTSCRNIK